jgi:hypothetical protein
MRVLKSLFVLVLIGVVGLLVWEFALAPTLAKRDARQAAGDVAQTAAHLIFVERNQPYATSFADAKKAATVRARADGTTLTAFGIDQGPVTVHVTINKQAKTLFIQHVNGLRDWAEFNQTATAQPR